MRTRILRTRETNHLWPFQALVDGNAVPAMTLPFKIVFEDDALLVINKPAGLLVESGRGSERSVESMASELLGKRVIAAHRLDRLTTGILILAKSVALGKSLEELFATRKVRKEYWAVVHGHWPNGVNRVETRIHSLGQGRFENSSTIGKRALTTFRVLIRMENSTLLQALPKTGRTHQIRLHCCETGHPIVGDSLYGDGGDSPQFFGLHARSARFRDPRDGQDRYVSAQVPATWPILPALE